MQYSAFILDELLNSHRTFEYIQRLLKQHVQKIQKCLQGRTRHTRLDGTVGRDGFLLHMRQERSRLLYFLHQTGNPLLELSELIRFMKKGNGFGSNLLQKGEFDLVQKSRKGIGRR